MKKRKEETTDAEFYSDARFLLAIRVGQAPMWKRRIRILLRSARCQEKKRIQELRKQSWECGPVVRKSHPVFLDRCPRCSHGATWSEPTFSESDESRPPAASAEGRETQEGKQRMSCTIQSQADCAGRVPSSMRSAFGLIGAAPRRAEQLERSCLQIGSAPAARRTVSECRSWMTV